MADRRERLEALVIASLAGVDAASSGCAEDAAHRLAHRRSDDAAAALARLDAGLDQTCTSCGGTIGAERLEAVVTAVQCAPCAVSGRT